MNAVRTGEVYLADLDPVVGSEQGRRRPVVIIQNPKVFGFTSTVLVVPLTTSMTLLGKTGICPIPGGEGGLTQDGLALGFQLRAIDARRLGRRLGLLPRGSIEKVADAVLAALGITIQP